MNRTGTTEAIKIMQAWLDGNPIEGRSRAIEPWAIEGWEPIVGDPQWDWTRFDYRIKPEPRVLHFAEFSNGALSYQPLSNDEVQRYTVDKGPKSTRLVKFVEVMDEPAKPEASIHAKYTFKLGDEGLTAGGWPYRVVSIDNNGLGPFMRVNHGPGRGDYWHDMQGKCDVEEYDLLAPGMKPSSQT